MYFLFVGRDKPDRQSARAATREQHRAYIWRRNLPARLLMGSPLVEGGEMVGSMLLLEATDRAAVEAYLDGDPYNAADIFAECSIDELHHGFDPEGQWKKWQT